MDGKAMAVSAIREMDRRAIAEFGIAGIVLMENAGRKAAEIIHAALPGDRVLILCGKGNNGGDGFVIARHLANWGRRVAVGLAAYAEDLRGAKDAWTNFSTARLMGIPMTPCLREGKADLAALTQLFKDCDAVVDALLGSGIRGEAQEPMREFIDRINDAGKPVFAVDLPSGLDADTGRPLGAAVRATRTLTFAAPKLGFAAATEYTGVVDLIDIGIPRQLYGGWA